MVACGGWVRRPRGCTRRCPPGQRPDGGRFLGDSPVFGADLRFFRTRRGRSCPPAPDAARTKADRAEGNVPHGKTALGPPTSSGGLRAASRSTIPSLDRSRRSTSKPSACTCSRGCRSWWSPVVCRMTSSSSRWMARNHRGKPATWSNSSSRPPGRAPASSQPPRAARRGWRTATGCRPPCRRRHRAAPAPGRRRGAGRPGGPAGRLGVGLAPAWRG
jgi:hypothetical protein